MIKDHGIFPLVIILLILITLSLDNVWILLGENCFWSLLALKGLNLWMKPCGVTIQVKPLCQTFWLSLEVFDVTKVKLMEV